MTTMQWGDFWSTFSYGLFFRQVELRYSAEKLDEGIYLSFLYTYLLGFYCSHTAVGEVDNGAIPDPI